MSGSLSRREVLGAGAGLAGMLAVPRMRVGSQVCLALEGGLDALAVVAPLAEARYRQLRLDTALRPGDGLALAGGRFLHPALAPLLPLLRAGRLGLVEGVGLPEGPREHPRARAAVETAADGRGILAEAQCALALAPRVPAAFAGAHGATHEAAAPRAVGGFRDSLLGRRLGFAAQLLESGFEGALYVSVPGFDTHAAQGGGRGRLAELLGDFAANLRAFHDRLGGRLERVRVFTLTELGRCPAENATSGTDDGGASAMFVMGGGARGGLWGHAPALDAPLALPVTTDVRAVLASLLTAGESPT